MKSLRVAIQVALTAIFLASAAMADQKFVNVGTSPDAGNGDPLYVAFGKINANFSDLYRRSTLVGPQGPRGNTIFTTSGLPIASVGINGDYALDPVAQVLYGPKANRAWPAGVPYHGTAGSVGPTGPTGAAGTNGNTVLSTSGPPSSSIGNNGDYAIDPAAQVLYGPKATGAWPTGISYRGTAGATGPTGPAATLPTITPTFGTVNGSFTSTQTMMYRITVTAGGGGGGGNGTGSSGGGGGGGGAGATCVDYQVLTNGSSYPYTIGAGGTAGPSGTGGGTAGTGGSTVFTGTRTITATGGVGGNSNGTTVVGADGGLGGTCTNATRPTNGASGNVGYTGSTGGGGGGGAGGGTGNGRGGLAGQAGRAATGYGGGGGGAGGTASNVGGVGFQGAVLIEPAL